MRKNKIFYEYMLLQNIWYNTKGIILCKEELGVQAQTTTHIICIFTFPRCVSLPDDNINDSIF